MDIDYHRKALSKNGIRRVDEETLSLRLYWKKEVKMTNDPETEASTKSLATDVGGLGGTNTASYATADPTEEDKEGSDGGAEEED